MAGYAAFAVIGTTKVGTGLDIRDLAPSDSYWTVFVNQDVKYFREQGPAFELVFPPGSIDWTAAEVGTCLHSRHLRETYLSLLDACYVLPPSYDAPARCAMPSHRI